MSETVEVLIRLPEKTYRKILSNEYDYGDMNVIIQAGTPLPKGHGRLADMDEALKCLEETADCKEKQYAIGMLEWAMGKRTLIDADRGDNNGDNNE